MLLCSSASTPSADPQSSRGRAHSTSLAGQAETRLYDFYFNLLSADVHPQSYEDHSSTCTSAYDYHQMTEGSSTGGVQPFSLEELDQIASGYPDFDQDDPNSAKLPELSDTDEALALYVPEIYDLTVPELPDDVSDWDHRSTTRDAETMEDNEASGDVAHPQGEAGAWHQGAISEGSGTQSAPTSAGKSRVSRAKHKPQPGLKWNGRWKMGSDPSSEVAKLWAEITTDERKLPIWLGIVDWDRVRSSNTNLKLLKVFRNQAAALAKRQSEMSPEADAVEEGFLLMASDNGSLRTIPGRRDKFARPTEASEGL